MRNDEEDERREMAEAAAEAAAEAVGEAMASNFSCGGSGGGWRVMLICSILTLDKYLIKSPS